MERVVSRRAGPSNEWHREVVGALLERVAATFSMMSCHKTEIFRPGLHFDWLQPVDFDRRPRHDKGRSVRSEVLSTF